MRLLSIVVVTTVMTGEAARSLGGSATAPLRPFRPDSVWNTPVPREASYEPVPGLAAKAVGLASWLGDTTAVPIYRSTTNDPLISVFYDENAYGKVVAGDWRRFGNSRRVEAQILRDAVPLFPFPGNVYSSQSATAWTLPASYDRFRNPTGGKPFQLHMPPGARPNTGYDGQLVVYQSDGTVFESYATIVLSTRRIVCMAYRITGPGGRGDGWQNGLTASMIPTYAGILTRADLASGTIPHAISIKLPGSLLAPAYVYPAAAFDRNPQTSAEEPYSGSVPMGGRLAIPRSVDLSMLGLTTNVGRMIARAVQTYGFIVVDRGGEGVTIDDEGAEGGIAIQPHHRAAADLSSILSALRLVSPTDTGPHRKDPGHG
jgi:hypothetical protein